jgi:hypothetical protein
MKKGLVVAALAVALLLAWIAAGPFLAIGAIRDAVRTENAHALARHVDFPPLRDSLKRQLRDALLRKAGGDMQSSLLGAFGLAIAGSASDIAVEAMVTPTGLGGLMEGRKAWNRFSGLPPPSREDAGTRPDPLQGARYRFESPSRFTATITHADGSTTVLVLARKGLRWQLTDVRLPL